MNSYSKSDMNIVQGFLTAPYNSNGSLPIVFLFGGTLFA